MQITIERRPIPRPNMTPRIGSGATKGIVCPGNNGVVKEMHEDGGPKPAFVSAFTQKKYCVFDDKL